MIRNSFADIRKYLFLADSKILQAGDNLSKVSHMHTLLNNQLIQYLVFIELFSIAESIMRERTVSFSSEVNRFGLDTSYGMHVIVTTTRYEDKGEAAYSILLGTRVVDRLMHVIRTIQMLLNTSCFFITGLKFFVIDFSSMSIY